MASDDVEGWLRNVQPKVLDKAAMIAAQSARMPLLQSPAHLIPTKMVTSVKNSIMSAIAGHDVIFKGEMIPSLLNFAAMNSELLSSLASSIVHIIRKRPAVGDQSGWFKLDFERRLKVFESDVASNVTKWIKTAGLSEASIGSLFDQSEVAEFMGTLIRADSKLVPNILEQINGAIITTDIPKSFQEVLLQVCGSDNVQFHTAAFSILCHMAALGESPIEALIPPWQSLADSLLTDDRECLFILDKDELVDGCWEDLSPDVIRIMLQTIRRDLTELRRQHPYILITLFRIEHLHRTSRFVNVDKKIAQIDEFRRNKRASGTILNMLDLSQQSGEMLNMLDAAFDPVTLGIVVGGLLRALETPGVKRWSTAAADIAMLGSIIARLRDHGADSDDDEFWESRFEPERLIEALNESGDSADRGLCLKLFAVIYLHVVRRMRPSSFKDAAITMGCEWMEKNSEYFSKNNGELWRSTFLAPAENLLESICTGHLGNIKYMLRSQTGKQKKVEFDSLKGAGALTNPLFTLSDFVLIQCALLYSTRHGHVVSNFHFNEDHFKAALAEDGMDSDDGNCSDHWKRWSKITSATNRSRIICEMYSRDDSTPYSTEILCLGSLAIQSHLGSGIGELISAKAALRVLHHILSRRPEAEQFRRIHFVTSVLLLSLNNRFVRPSTDTWRKPVLKMLYELFRDVGSEPGATVLTDIIDAIIDISFLEPNRAGSRIIRFRKLRRAKIGQLKKLGKVKPCQLALRAALSLATRIYWQSGIDLNNESSWTHGWKKGSGASVLHSVTTNIMGPMGKLLILADDDRGRIKTQIRDGMVMVMRACHRQRPEQAAFWFSVSMRAMINEGHNTNYHMLDYGLTARRAVTEYFESGNPVPLDNPFYQMTSSQLARTLREVVYKERVRQGGIPDDMNRGAGTITKSKSATSTNFINQKRSFAVRISQAMSRLVHGSELLDIVLRPLFDQWLYPVVDPKSLKQLRREARIGDTIVASAWNRQIDFLTIVLESVTRGYCDAKDRVPPFVEMLNVARYLLRYPTWRFGARSDTGLDSWAEDICISSQDCRRFYETCAESAANIIIWAFWHHATSCDIGVLMSIESRPEPESIDKEKLDDLWSNNEELIVKTFNGSRGFNLLAKTNNKSCQDRTISVAFALQSILRGAVAESIHSEVLRLTHDSLIHEDRLATIESSALGRSLEILLWSTDLSELDILSRTKLMLCVLDQIDYAINAEHSMNGFIEIGVSLLRKFFATGGLDEQSELAEKLATCLGTILDALVFGDRLNQPSFNGQNRAIMEGVVGTVTDVLSEAVIVELRTNAAFQHLNRIAVSGIGSEDPQTLYGCCEIIKVFLDQKMTIYGGVIPKCLVKLFRSSIVILGCRICKMIADAETPSLIDVAKRCWVAIKSSLDSIGEWGEFGNKLQTSLGQEGGNDKGIWSALLEAPTRYVISDVGVWEISNS